MAVTTDVQVTLNLEVLTPAEKTILDRFRRVNHDGTKVLHVFVPVATKLIDGPLDEHARYNLAKRIATQASDQAWNVTLDATKPDPRADA